MPCSARPGRRRRSIPRRPLAYYGASFAMKGGLAHNGLCAYGASLAQLRNAIEISSSENIKRIQHGQRNSEVHRGNRVHTVRNQTVQRHEMLVDGLEHEAVGWQRMREPHGVEVFLLRAPGLR